MSEDETKIIDEGSFEGKVLGQLQRIHARLSALEKREAERELETKPGFADILREVREINTNVQTYLKNFERKLSIVVSDLLQVRADQQVLTDRVSKLEVETRPQIIPQERHF